MIQHPVIGSICYAQFDDQGIIITSQVRIVGRKGRKYVIRMSFADNLYKDHAVGAKQLYHTQAEAVAALGGL